MIPTHLRQACEGLYNIDIYEDKSQAVEDRVNDLISQMTIKEKAGSMFIDIVKVSFENESIKNRKRQITRARRGKNLSAVVNLFYE